MADEKPAASVLSEQNAEKIDKAESIWGLIATPRGVASIIAIITAVGAMIGQFTGKAPLPTDGTPIKVEITNFPVIQLADGSLVPPLPVPSLPKATKVGIAVFTKQPPPALVNDAALWKQFTDKGHAVQFYTAGTAEADAWKPYTDKAGPMPCFVVVDRGKEHDNYLGGHPLDSKSSVESNIKAHIGSK